MMFLGSVLREILPATILLLVVLIAGGVVIMRARKMVKRKSNNELPFTMDQLRQLHKNREIDDEEFERAKKSMLKSLRE